MHADERQVVRRQHKGGSGGVEEAFMGLEPSFQWMGVRRVWEAIGLPRSTILRSSLEKASFMPARA